MRIVFFGSFTDFSDDKPNARAKRWMKRNARGTHGRLGMSEYGFIEFYINDMYRLTFNDRDRTVNVHFDRYPLPACTVMNVELVPTRAEMLLFNDYPNLFNISEYRNLYLEYSTRSRATMLPIPRTLVLKVAEYM